MAGSESLWAEGCLPEPTTRLRLYYLRYLLLFPFDCRALLLRTGPHWPVSHFHREAVWLNCSCNASLCLCALPPNQSACSSGFLALWLLMSQATWLEKEGRKRVRAGYLLAGFPIRGITKVWLHPSIEKLSSYQSAPFSELSLQGPIAPLGFCLVSCDFSKPCTPF